MDRAARTRVIALVVLLAISIPLVVIAVTGGDGDEPGSGGGGEALRVEPAQGAPEILVFVEDPEANTLEATDGAKQVRIECLDAAGEVVVAEREPWPFTDTDDGLFAPHAHVFVEPALLREIVRCRLGGTDPLLEGRKT